MGQPSKTHPEPQRGVTFPACGRWLKKAGALLSLDGLQPLTTGARLAFSGGQASVTDGPLVEAREVVGGYWMLQARSK
jgi:hypothetical protein